MSENAIEVRNLCVDYVPFKKTSVHKNFFNKKKKKAEVVHAVKDISFDVKKGEIVGIVGTNGSGKSTLLRAVGGIFTPDSGTVDLKGNSISLLSIGVGFIKDLSGRENIMLSAMLMGCTEQEARAKVDEIIDFSGLRKFIDYPVRTYSSGMYSKLAFSITVSIMTDIILLDEIFSVGDEKFKRKSSKRMKQLISDDARTVMMVSHNMKHIRDMCDRVIWIEAGEVVMMGPTEEVLEKYIEFMEKDD